VTVGILGYVARPDHLIIFLAGFFITTVWTGAIAFFPTLVAIVIAEAFGWRSPFYYLLVGGAVGLLANQIHDLYGEIYLSDQQLVIMLGAGFVGGFTYWLIAGRLAGGRPSGDSASETT